MDYFIEALGQQNDSNEWRLFVDSSKLGLKVVLVHNWSKYHSVPVDAIHMETSCDNMRHLVLISNMLNILGKSAET
jgi:hypothetical protein